jgi:putative tryptophan/tyrosine transport system substrate-binding protein
VAGRCTGERMRRIGVLSTVPADDTESQVRMAAFHQGLQEVGWIVGHNLRIDYRWSGAGDAQQVRQYANELVALAPEVILGVTTAAVGPLQQATRTTPIIFVQVSDPVGTGFVESLARPGGNTTGFTLFEFGLSAKWLELLKELAPTVTRALVFRDPGLTSGIAQFAVMQSAGLLLGVDVTPIGVTGASDMERAVGAMAQQPNGGLIVLPGSLTLLHRKLIIALAAHYRLPAVYPYRYHISDGGLISYGPDATEQYRRAAGYVDRILKGEKPANLPVQRSTKFEFVINLKTAKALGVAVPNSMQLLADEVIE